ncbi:putative quinol monooxygenase [Neisseria chenwenguii]|uniref:putative quinol monooxygenase n=1 Tax=Neisseria chenwenguii TaxID=1853278 RepID=UPI000F4E0AF6|nr:putative quinol monooxygenase [Neisseria chenwenguii]ROV56082.1 antibiotic biosynthesis monooxygenase [Neisseria chenwenguii]
MTVGVITLCNVKPDKHAEFEAVARRFVSESNTHQGCISYFCGKVANAENQFIFQEHWVDRAAFDAHCSHPFFKANEAELLGCLSDGKLHLQIVDAFE